MKDGVKYTTKFHYGERVKRLGIGLDTLDCFVPKVQRGKIEGEGIRVNIRNDDGELVEKQVRTFRELQELVEESYPKTEQKDDKQQPGMNVITATVAATDVRYLRYTHYKRYKYIFDNFEYLTGLNVNEVMKVMNTNDHDELDNDERAAINRLLRNRDPAKAKRIELDSIIKVVRANLFSDFILEKLQELFPERNYNRAIKWPTEYFGDKFHILPKNIQELFLYCTEIANTAVKPTEETIEIELKNWTPTDEEIERGIPRLLKIHDENALIEMRTSKAVADNPEMQALGKKAGELLNSLPQLKSDIDDEY